jgi:hypothetical protein
METTLGEVFGKCMSNKDFNGKKLLNLTEKEIKKMGDFKFKHICKLIKEITKIKENNNCN